MNSEGLSPALRPYLLLFMKLLLESPVQRGESLIPYEEVVFALEKDTISKTSGIGLESDESLKCGPNSHVAMVTLQVEPKKYKTIVNWIIDILKFSKFTAERVRVIASKMHNRLSEVKGNAMSMIENTLNFILYSQESNVGISTVFRHQKFLTALLKKLDDPDELATILSDLNAIRDFLTKADNLSIHIATNISDDIKKRVNLSKVWGRISSAENGDFKNALKVIPEWKHMNKGFDLKDGSRGTVIGMGSVENAIMFHVVESINDYNSPDLPALMLHLQYFSQFEGPLWKKIRGQGLAYSSQILSKPSEGLILFRLFRSVNVMAGFKEVKNIVETHLQDRSWDENLLESARNSLIYKVVQNEISIGGLVSQGLSFSYRKVPSNYNHMLVEKINRITKQQLNHVGEKYISKLFSTAARTAIVCHPDKVKEIMEGFASMNIILSGASSSDESILNH